MVALALSITLHLHKHIRATRFAQPHCTPPNTTHRVLVLCSTIVTAPCCHNRTTPTSILHLINQPDILPSTPRCTAHPNPPNDLSPHHFAPTLWCSHHNDAVCTQTLNTRAHKKAKQHAAQQTCHSMLQHSSQQAVVNDSHHHTARGSVPQC